MSPPQLMWNQSLIQRLEVRVRSLERWRALRTGEDRRGRASGALLGGFLGGVVAVLARIWWG